MSDPRMSDPRLSDPRDYRRPELGRTSGDVNAVWGWVAAAAFVAVVLLFVFASGNDNKNASNNGISMPPTASAPNLPRNTPSTTGAGPANPAPANPGPATPSAPSGNH
jgi:hypothetical protein